MASPTLAATPVPRHADALVSPDGQPATAPPVLSEKGGIDSPATTQGTSIHVHEETSANPAPSAPSTQNSEEAASTSLREESPTDSAASASTPQTSEEAANTDTHIKDSGPSSKSDTNDSVPVVPEQSKAADDAIKTDEQSNEEPRAGDEDDKSETENKADLWCKETGESHEVLTRFGTWECPMCNQSLKKPIKTQSDKDASTKDDSTKDSSDTEKEPTQDSTMFSHSIRYLDDGYYILMTEPWKGPFSLSEARKDIPQSKEPLFTVQTDLVTSIPCDSDRGYQDLEQIKKNGILKDPTVSVKKGKTRLTTQSTALTDVIRKLVSYYPSASLDTKTVEFWSPYELFWQYQDRFEQYLTEKHEGDTQETSKHLRQLLDFVKSSNGEDVEKERGRYERGMCTYDMLWLLYTPGDVVYVETYGRLSAFVISDVSESKRILKEDAQTPVGYTLTLWCLDYDGIHVGRRRRKVFLRPFDGERKILDLRVIPCKNKDAEDKGKTRESLIEDGKKWYRLLRGGQCYYSGRLLDERQKEVSVPSFENGLMVFCAAVAGF